MENGGGFRTPMDGHVFTQLPDKTILLQDGTKKVILNAKAFNQAGDHDLQGFLRYVKTGEVTTGYTGRIEQMIQTVKQNELARRE